MHGLKDSFILILLEGDWMFSSCVWTALTSGIRHPFKSALWTNCFEHFSDVVALFMCLWGHRTNWCSKQKGKWSQGCSIRQKVQLFYFCDQTAASQCCCTPSGKLNSSFLLYILYSVSFFFFHFKLAYSYCVASLATTKSQRKLTNTELTATWNKAWQQCNNLRSRRDLCRDSVIVCSAKCVCLSAWCCRLI